jgi:hypothetical protein
MRYEVFHKIIIKASEIVSAAAMLIGCVEQPI